MPIADSIKHHPCGFGPPTADNLRDVFARDLNDIANQRRQFGNFLQQHPKAIARQLHDQRRILTIQRFTILILRHALQPLEQIGTCQFSTLDGHTVLFDQFEQLCILRQALHVQNQQRSLRRTRDIFFQHWPVGSHEIVSIVDQHDPLIAEH